MSLQKALYLIDVVSSLDLACSIVTALAFVSIIITIIGTFCNYDLPDESSKMSFKFCKKLSIILAVIIFVFGSFMVLIPSQKTMYAMLISDNYTEIKDEVRDNVDYIFNKVDELMDKKESK